MSEITDKLRAMVFLDEVGSNNPFGRDVADYIDRLEGALRLFTLIDFDRGSEHDEQLLSDALDAARALNTTPGAHDGR